jgi:mannose-6-phosphate isomerase-like protein (cupin superfamily)
MLRIVNKAELLATDIALEFEGEKFGGTNVTFLLVMAPPGTGPRLHTHPYDEVLIIQEGQVTVIAGEERLELKGGQIVVVPAGTPHKWMNSGTDVLRQVDIHLNSHFITEWLEL